MDDSKRSGNRSRYAGSRRQFLKFAGAAGTVGVTGLAGCLGGIGGGPPTIRVLGWATFEEVQDEIEAAVDAEVEITGVTSTEPMFTQWNAGQNEEFDVTMPNNDWVPQFIEADLLAPLDTDLVPNWDDIYPRYQELAAEQAGADGEIYGVPQRFGWDTYAYDTRDVPEHEEDLSILFDGEYAGELGMFQQHRKSMSHTALYLGYRDALEGDRITLSEDQIEEVKNTLLEQKSGVESYYAAPPQIRQLFTDGDISLGMTYRFVTAQMRRDGEDWIQMAVPEQGAMTWYEAAVVSKESENKEAAWEVVNAIIDPDVIGEWLAGVGIASTNSTVADSLPGDQGEIIDIQPERVENMIAYKTVENEDAWVSAWEEVRTA